MLTLAHAQAISVRKQTSVPQPRAARGIGAKRLTPTMRNRRRSNLRSRLRRCRGRTAALAPVFGWPRQALGSRELAVELRSAALASAAGSEATPYAPWATLTVHERRTRRSAATGPPQAEAGGGEVAAGDGLLLVSDGVWENVADADLEAAIQAEDLAGGLRRVVDGAKARCGPECDNLSVAAARCRETFEPNCASLAELRA